LSSNRKKTIEWGQIALPPRMNRVKFSCAIGPIGFISCWLGNTALPRLLIITHAVYPHFVWQNDFSYFCSYKTQNQAKNIPVVLPSSHIKIGFWVMIEHTNKQTDKQRLLLYIFKDTLTGSFIIVICLWAKIFSNSHKWFGNYEWAG